MGIGRLLMEALISTFIRLLLSIFLVCFPLNRGRLTRKETYDEAFKFRRRPSINKPIQESTMEQKRSIVTVRIRIIIMIRIVTLGIIYRRHQVLAWPDTRFRDCEQA